MAYLTSDDLKTVKKFLFSARKKWYNIGLELGLKADKLDEIQDNCGKNYDEGLLRMLQIWLKSFPNRPTWDQLAKALTDEAIDEAELAERGMYMQASKVCNTCTMTFYLIHREQTEKNSSSRAHQCAPSMPLNEC